MKMLFLALGILSFSTLTMAAKLEGTITCDLYSDEKVSAQVDTRNGNIVYQDEEVSVRGYLDGVGQLAIQAGSTKNESIWVESKGDLYTSDKGITTGKVQISLQGIKFNLITCKFQSADLKADNCNEITNIVGTVVPNEVLKFLIKE